MDATGETLARLISELLSDCNVAPPKVRLISVHGTATRLNDLAEARAIHRVFGESTSGLSCFGLKGAIGHLMGAAGAVESAATVLALSNQIIPPTVNHESPDEACRLRLLADSTAAEIEYAMKISLGFGGHLAVGLLRRTSK